MRIANYKIYGNYHILVIALLQSTSWTRSQESVDFIVRVIFGDYC